MDVNKSPQEQGLKWRCKQHPTFPCELICLDGNYKDRVVCFGCAQKQLIPFSNLVSMSCVLEAKNHDILEAYPPLKDEELSDYLKNIYKLQNLEEMDVCFKKLRDDVEKEIQAAEQRTKQQLIKQDRVREELLKGYMEIAEVEKLKQLIVSDKESAEKDLDDFIKDKWSKADENRKLMLNLINQHDVKQFSSDEPNRIIQQVTQSLKSINFFQQQLSSQITLIKSIFNSSQQLEVTKVDNSIYQVKKRGNYYGHDQVFIDPILNPLKKYILHIELEQRPGTNNNSFCFGLVKDKGKELSSAQNENMCYYDNSNTYGVTHYIKGSLMQSGNKVIGKHSFEVRICLNQRFLRVACLPDYSSIVELDNPRKIDSKVAYRFFLSMDNQGDMMRITDMKTVSEFDGKM